MGRVHPDGRRPLHREVGRGGAAVQRLEHHAHGHPLHVQLRKGLAAGLVCCVWWSIQMSMMDEQMLMEKQDR